ncbi:hypothetical protein GW17_00041997, partial [Ensete ventricosum]
MKTKKSQSSHVAVEVRSCYLSAWVIRWFHWRLATNALRLQSDDPPSPTASRAFSFHISALRRISFPLSPS